MSETVKNRENGKNGETTKTRRFTKTRSRHQDSKECGTPRFLSFSCLRGSSCFRGFRRLTLFVTVTALCLLWISAGGPRVSAQKPKTTKARRATKTRKRQE